VSRVDSEYWHKINCLTFLSKLYRTIYIEIVGGIMSFLNALKIVLIILLFVLIVSIISCGKNSTDPTIPENYALSFDGVDDIVTVNAKGSNLDNITNQLTIESWIFIRSFPNVAPRIVDRSDNEYGAPSGDRFVFSLFGPDYAAAFNINGYVVKSNGLSLEKWIHVAGTFNGEEIKIYVNGDLNNTLNHLDSLNVTESNLCFGNNDSLSIRQFDGYIDEIRIWNVSRSQVEINESMNKRLTGSETGIIGYWNFNEKSGQDVLDKTKNKINGILGISTEIDSSDPERIKFDFPYKN
jgi:hypothetical protein